MKNSGYFLLCLPVLILGFLIFTACSDVYIIEGSGHGRGYGPPPHAPAHGYRAKTHDGVEIVFDADLNLYVVVGMRDHYYYKDRYYRRQDGHWEHSEHIHGDWKRAERKHLPPGLRRPDEPGKKPGSRR